jgi:carbon storage regulator CsrA
MLVLTRRQGEITILDFSGMSDAELMALRANGPLRMTVVEIRGDKVRFGFEAPKTVKIDRKEIYEQRLTEMSEGIASKAR